MPVSGLRTSVYALLIAPYLAESATALVRYSHKRTFSVARTASTLGLPPAQVHTSRANGALPDALGVSGASGRAGASTPKASALLPRRIAPNSPPRRAVTAYAGLPVSLLAGPTSSARHSHARAATDFSRPLSLGSTHRAASQDPAPVLLGVWRRGVAALLRHRIRTAAMCSSPSRRTQHSPPFSPAQPPAGGCGLRSGAIQCPRSGTG